MSAGTGQQHRIATSGVSSSPSQKTANSLKRIQVQRDWNKWSDWLQSLNIQTTKLLSYYLGNDPGKNYNKSY